MYGHQVRVLGGLVAVAAVVLVAWWGVGTPDPRAADGEAILWPEASAEVRVVEAPGRWGLRRDAADAAWEPLAPSVGVDPEAAHDLLDALDEGRRGVVVEGALADFGLDEPTVLRVTTSAGTREIHVGDAAPVGGRTYARSPEGPVIAVYGGLRAAVDAMDAQGAAAVGGSR